MLDYQIPLRLAGARGTATILRVVATPLMQPGPVLPIFVP